MKMLVIATAAALGLGIPTPAHAASEIDCMVMWNKADVYMNGTLAGKEATAYLDAIRKSGKKYEMKIAGQLSSTEFMAACKDDAFKISFYRV
jgi:PPE-repeat protein